MRRSSAAGVPGLAALLLLAVGACGGDDDGAALDAGEPFVPPASDRTDASGNQPPLPGTNGDAGASGPSLPDAGDAAASASFMGLRPIVPDAALVAPPIVEPDAAPPPEAGSSPQAQDPCQGESSRGRCISPSELRACATPTGNDTPAVVSTVCQPFEICEEGASGAACVARPGLCKSGTRQCQGPGQIAVCQDTRWQVLDCPGGCLDTAFGDFCRLKLETRTYTGKLGYQARRPKSDLTDWEDATFVAPMQGVVLTSFRGEEIVDADITDANGAYTLEIPAEPAPNDRLQVHLIHPNAAKTGLAFGVARPDLPDGEQEPRNGPVGEPALWRWELDPKETPSGTTLVITEALGSGAVRVFDNLRFAYTFARGGLGMQGKPLVVFMRPNTGWKCGACFLGRPARVEDLEFDAQMFIPMLAQDQSYWSDSTTMHELGHWVMMSHGVSPGEGGKHCVGVPVQPGMGWSEGWASGFSGLARKSPLFVSKQRGTMFWIDLDERTASENRAIQRPVAARGLLQQIDEYEVAAMIYRLGSTDPMVGPDRLLAALASPRMKVPPFGRGYTTHRWRDTDASCRPVELTKTDESAPMFADFLDALVCAGLPAAFVDGITEPARHYPYPSQSPICK